MRSISAAALSTAVLLAGVGAASADDIVKLGGPSAQATIQGGTDIALAAYRGGGHGGGHGGYHGGHYAHYGHGHYGHYGHGHYGHYGHYGHHGHYANYWRGYYPWGYGLYARAYFGYPRLYGYYGGYYPYASYYAPSYYYSDPCDYSVAAETLPAPAQATYYPQRLSPTTPVGTFPYNGGPVNVVPMPISAPKSGPIVLPADGRLVSLQTTPTGGTTQMGNRQSAPTTTAPTVRYPAYGEEPIVPAPRKAVR